MPGLQQPGYGVSLVAAGTRQFADALDTSRPGGMTSSGGMVDGELGGGEPVVDHDVGEPDYWEITVGYL